MPVAAPTATLIAQIPSPGGRRVRVRLAANGAASMTLIAPPEAGLHAAGSGSFMRRFGQGEATGKYYVRCVGRACDGAEIDLVIGTAQPVELTIVGTRSGLPDAAAPLVRARPGTARAQYGADATIAIGRTRL